MLTVLIVSMVFTPLIAVVLLARTSSMVTEATRRSVGQDGLRDREGRMDGGSVGQHGSAS